LRATTPSEVNNTFYRWPRDETFESWREQVPADFSMTIKASRALSHSKRLREPEEWMARMVEGMEHLGEKLGVFLVQLPPNFACDLDRLRHFLGQVPGSLKVSMEFCHPSWHTEEVFALLEEYNASLHHERRGFALHASRHSFFCLRKVARAG